MSSEVRSGLVGSHIAIRVLKEIKKVGDQEWAEVLCRFTETISLYSLVP
jgi:hypothetical protein